MQRKVTSLSEKRQRMTRDLILDTAFVLLRDAAIGELTMRAVAQQANISERTVFRYFPSRDALLDAVAEYVIVGMAIPPPPDSIDSLLSAPRLLYEAFEDRADFTRAALHPDIGQRIRTRDASIRLHALMSVLAHLGSATDAVQLRIAAANIYYHLTPNSWNFYRFTIAFDLAESITCAETAVRHALQGVCGSPVVRPLTAPA